MHHLDGKPLHEFLRRWITLLHLSPFRRRRGYFPLASRVTKNIIRSRRMSSPCEQKARPLGKRLAFATMMKWRAECCMQYSWFRGSLYVIACSFVFLNSWERGTGECVPPDGSIELHSPPCPSKLFKRFTWTAKDGNQVVWNLAL